MRAVLLLALAGCSTSNVIATEQGRDAGEPPPGCVEVDRRAELDVPTNTWERVTPVGGDFRHRGLGKIVYDSERQLFLFWGGYVDDGDPLRYPYTIYANALFTFDPVTNELRLDRTHHWYNAGVDYETVAYPENAGDPTPPDRYPTHTFAFAPDLGAAFQWSGQNEALVLPPSTERAHPLDLWRYDVGTRAWTELLPPARPATHSDDQAMIHAPGELIVYAADTELGQPRETWRYDIGANTWRASLPDPSPPPRPGGAGFEYDSRRGVAVLYGGGYDVVYDDLWEYSAASGAWTPAGTSPAGARTRHGFAYDCRHDTFVVTGGTTSAIPPAMIYMDTWTLAGGAWEELENGPLGPAGEIYGSLAYSPAHDVFLAIEGEEEDYRFWLLRLP